MLYIKNADPKEVCDIEDRIGEYLVESAKTPSKQRLLTCFVCGRQARGNSHNIKDCIQIADVSLQVDGQMRYAKATSRPLNTCVKGFHSHQTYADQLECATNGDGRFAVIREFMKLEGEGATPCSQCGDVFPTHQPGHCPNYPYLTMGDQGFKAAYDAWIVAILERLQAVARRIDGGETTDAVSILYRVR